MQDRTTMRYVACNFEIITCMFNFRNTQEISKCYHLRGLRNAWIQEMLKILMNKIHARYVYIYIYINK